MRKRIALTIALVRAKMVAARARIALTIALVRAKMVVARARIALATARRVVTLDIDSTGIRLLELRGRTVTRWASMPLETGDTEGKAFSNPKSLSINVKRLMNSSGIKARKVVTSFSGLYSVSRLLNLSSSPKRLITRQTVLDSIKETLSLNVDELYLSWQTLSVNKDTQQFLVVGVPRDVMDARMRAVRAAGIHPQLLELRTMSLVRAVNREQALILNIEPSSFDIVIVVNGIPEVMRTIAWQQDGLSAAAKAEHLAANLELTVNFYNSHYIGTSLDPATPVFITGQMSGDSALMDELQARIRYPVESLAPRLNYPAGLPISQYAANIGLALKGKGKAPSRPEQGKPLPLYIDLLPEAYQPWRISAKQLGFALAVVGCIALVVLLYQASTAAQTKTTDLEIKYSLLNNELQRRQIEIKNRVPLQKAIEEFNLILAKRTNFTQDLKVIYDTAKKVGVQVESVVHEGKNLSVTYKADNYILFREYSVALQNTGRFSNFKFPPEGIPFIKSGPITFEPKTAAKAPPPTSPAPK